jgi:biopolymer transport protein ExbB/TolQ
MNQLPAAILSGRFFRVSVSSVSGSRTGAKDGPLLLLAVTLVGVVCIPLWLGRHGFADLAEGDKWTNERLARLLLGPEQIVCYMAFVWALFLLLARWLEAREQRRALSVDWLPTEPGVRILPEDAYDLLRRTEQRMARNGQSILGNMLRLALTKFAASRSGRDVGETVRAQAETDLGRYVSGMATVHYLAWALPAIGFLGTVRGLASALSLGGLSGQDVSEIGNRLNEATRHLNVAFDCTLVALGLSVVLMFLLHAVQRDQEEVVLDSQQYCLEYLVTRLYESESGERQGGGLPWESAAKSL